MLCVGGFCVVCWRVLCCVLEGFVLCMPGDLSQLEHNIFVRTIFTLKENIIFCFD